MRGRWTMAGVRIEQARSGLRGPALGHRLHAAVGELLLLHRSLTGDGVRSTLALLGRDLPMVVHEVPTGTAVLDWTVPSEWNLHEAWIADSSGHRVLDVAAHPLHVMGYSVPVRTTLELTELRQRITTLPDRPDAIPYRTAYYTSEWGFCAAESDVATWPDGRYEVCIDATLAPGTLTYGEVLLPGTEEHEVLLTTHVCHPGMANDNGSGMALLAEVGRQLMTVERRYTYRLLFAPGTLGAITWLARNDAVLPRIRHGLVLTGLGDPARLSYKRSRAGDHTIDRATELVLRRRDPGATVEDFSPYGYDERQFGSPGFDLPVGRLARSRHGEYPQYHTSLDDLDFVCPEALADALDALLEVLGVLEADRTYRNLRPHGEPQLGRRGLYRAVGGGIGAQSREMGLLWVLNQSDGTRSLLDIAQRSGLPFTAVAAAADALVAHHLLEVVHGG